MKDILVSRGYTYVDNASDLRAFRGDKLVGTFGKTAKATSMSYDLDRDPSIEPSISRMTAKAIEILSKNEKGFFLMVEGSKIDWAAHANDPVALITDIIAFDEAVKVALDFAKQDGNTVVIAATDHGNSGISVGDRSISSGYDKTPWTTFINPLKRASLTGEGLEAILAAKGADRVKADVIRDAVAMYMGISDLTDAEVAIIASAKPGSLNYAIGPMVASRAKIGFTTNGHTGEDVVLYAYDPFGKRLTGLVRNTDIADYMAATMKLDLAETTSRLFKDAISMFSKKGATVTVDKTDPENLVLVVTKGDKTLRIPRNKSVVYLNGEVMASDGVAVFNGSKWYVAENVISLIK
jgi:alkaline phosphatase